jgi:hypothetical protein
MFFDKPSYSHMKLETILIKPKLGLYHNPPPLSGFGTGYSNLRYTGGKVTLQQY